jgi:BASS family bile acid:Na+ symporter
MLSIGRPAILVFILTGIVVIRLIVKVRDLMAPMKDRRFMLASIVAYLILVPILAFIIFIVPVSRETAAGLVLLGLVAGVPSTPKAADPAQDLGRASHEKEGRYPARMRRAVFRGSRRCTTLA